MNKNQKKLTCSLPWACSWGLALALSLAPATAEAEQRVGVNSTDAVAQAGPVTGHVQDENGEPLIGVTVTVVGGTVGAISDIDGNFSLRMPSGKKELSFSYAGYKTKVVTVSGGNVNVSLEPDALGLEEVVVIGFGTVKKRDVTGSVASVKSETLLQAPTSDVTSALQGRVTGLDINADGEMRIRGNRSINGNNAPLVIIDGVQGGSISDLNPDDIETVDVLKDASSTAIYGSQGANGVIIITTKKAEAGKMNISYNGYVRGAFREQHPDYRSGSNWYEAMRLSAANAGQWSSTADDQNLFNSLAGYAAYRANAWTDYDKELQKDLTWGTRHTVTLSGGNERTSGRFSVGYANNGSKWKESGGWNRYTLRANIDHKLYKWIDAGVNFQLTHNTSENSPYQSTPTTGMQLGSPYGYYDDVADKYVIGNTLVERPLSASEYVNPLINLKDGALYSRETYGTNVVANGYLDIHPIDGLSFRTQFNTHITNYSWGDYADKNSATVIDAGSKQSTARMQKSSSLYTEWNNILTYQFKMLPEDHHLSLTLLTTWSKKTTDNLSATSINQTLASNLWWNLASNDGGDGHSTHTSGYTKQQNFSYAGRISYDWKSRYLFTASLRRDGASVLAEGNKWETFPSVAVAWRASDEPFMKVTKSWLDDLKVRVTYGVTGNAGIPVYGSSTGVSFANWSFGFQDTAANRYTLGVQDAATGYSLVQNKNITWEKSKTVDIGFDAMLFNNRVSITFDYYNTKTTDLILLRSLPTSAGNDGKFATYTNIGSTRNKGVELTINSRNIVTKDFNWNTTLNFSTNKEEILDLVDGTDIQMGTEKETSTLMLGHPIKSFKTFEYLGIWTTAEAAEAATYFKDAEKTQPFQPGDIKVADLDGDHVIDQNKDIKYLGSTSPKWFAGFNNDFRYKNWDLNIYIFARWGHWGESPLASFDPSTGGKYETMDYWVAGSNEGGSLPALKLNSKLFDYVGYQSLGYCEQSFIKLKRVTVGYSLPKSVVKKLNIQRARVYATVDNPLYIVKEDWMKQFDPEGQQRSVTLGVSVNF